MAAFNDSTPFIQALLPRERWAVRRAEKDQNLNLAQMQTQLAMQQQAQEQQAIAQQMQVDQLIQQLPLQGPDKKRLVQFREQQRQKLSKYIQENYKNPAEFLRAEGPTAAQQQLAEIQNSDVFINGITNSQHIALAMEARKKGEYLVGEMGQDGTYTAGEQQLADFYAGKRDSFRFSRSYKPDTSKVYEYFGKQDNPLNKFDNSAFVPQAEVVNFLRSQNDPIVIADMAARNMIPGQVSYKRYSIQDAMKFNTDMAKDNIDMQAKKQAMGLNNLKAQKLQNELSGGGGTGGLTFMNLSAGSALVSERTAFTPKPGEDYTLQTTGKSLTSYAGNGVLEFSKLGMPTKAIQDGVKALSGIQEGGSVGELVFPYNGGGIMRLNQVPNRVVSIDGNVYAPSEELANYRSGMASDGFLKVKVAVSEKDADKLGMYNDNAIWWDTDTEKGRGKYTRDPKTNELIFEGYVPSKGLINNPLLDLLGTKNMMGTKYADDYAIEF